MNKNGTMARPIKTPAERIKSGRTLGARDGNATDSPRDNSFEPNTVVDANLWAEPTNAQTAR